MNFTSDVKREIISRGISGGAAGKAALSAFVRTSGLLSVREGVPIFFIISETENVAEFFTALFEREFQEELSVARASVDRMSGRGKLVLELSGENSAEILYALGLVKRNGAFSKGIPKKMVSDRECALAYIKGAFLGGGSCILPSDEGRTGYHLEFVFPEQKPAEDFRVLLDGEELLAKTVKRSGAFVVYVKSKETISDFLSVVGAENALRKFSLLVEKRDEANRNNRAANCFSGNADKTATAAVRQVMAIHVIEENVGLCSLEEEMRETAKARLDYPALSLKELAEKLSVSKSCLNHRMRRLEEISRECRRND